jgi:hypothetical protein
MACTVYDWHEGDNPERLVHLVQDQDDAGWRTHAYCGTLPGRQGWVIWIGNVPKSQRCAACYAKLR